MNTGESIQMAYQLHIVGYQLGFNFLSTLLGVMVGGLISFFTARYIFRKQIKQDLEAMKVDKTLDLMSKVLSIHLLLTKKSNGESYKNPFSNMSNDGELDIFISSLYYIKIHYKLITNKSLSFKKEVTIINQYFITESKEWEANSSEDELIYVKRGIVKKLMATNKEIEKLLG